MFVVTGSTGNTGSVVVDTLLAAKKRVRAVVRNPASAGARALAERGAEVVAGDIKDAASIAKALEGAEGAYLLSPPEPSATGFVEGRAALFHELAGVLRDAKLPHVVLLSSIGAQTAAGTGTIRSVHVAEEALADSGAATTFVRAGYFAENWLAVLPAAKGDGVLPSFLPKSLVVPTVATRDIGRVAAEALLAGPRGKRIIELAGPTDPTADDVAAAVARVIGRTVSVVEAPLAAVAPTFAQFGASPEAGELYRQMYEGFANGTIAWEPEPSRSGAERVRGTVTLEQVFRSQLA